MKGLGEVLRRQIARNGDKNLLHDGIQDFMEMDPLFLACLEELLEGSAPVRRDRQEEMVSIAARSLVERLYALNQYMQVSEGQRRALEQIYSDTWSRIMDTRDIPGVLKSFHYPGLRNWAMQFWPDSLRTALRFRVRLGRIPNEEYPAELQLKLLRIDFSRMKQPVLDLGCGKHASLVRYLRSRKVIAFGVDRGLEATAEYLGEADWLFYRYEPRTWGTVISNLAFSNHYAYIDRYEPGKAATYKMKYKEILESLEPGGSFIYAPGVESLEAEVDRNRYGMEEWVIHPPYRGVKVTRGALSP
jgi:hypothetical protein